MHEDTSVHESPLSKPGPVGCVGVTHRIEAGQSVTVTFVIAWHFANINRGIEPALNRLPGIANGLDDAVKRTDRLIASMETGYGANSQVNRDIARLMVQLSDAARSIRVLADLLARHPEALIRGRTSQGP